MQRESMSSEGRPHEATGDRHPQAKQRRLKRSGLADTLTWDSSLRKGGKLHLSKPSGPGYFGVAALQTTMARYPR